MGVPEILLALFVIFLGSRVMNYFRYAKQTAYLPGLRSFATPISAWGAAFPTSRFNPGLNWQWEWRKEVYARAGTETISALPYVMGVPAIYTSSLEVARQIVSTKGQFHKTPDITAITLLWGPNLFAANGEEWKRFRRIITPAFAQATYAALWKESKRVYDEMVVGEGWSTRSTIDIPAINPLTNKFALIIISTSGFGNALSWDFMKASPSDKMSFGEALSILAHDHILRLILPKWVYMLPVKKLRDMEEASKTALGFLTKMIQTRRRELAAGVPMQNDILSLMIRSTEEEYEGSKMSMTDEELIGNTFILLFAGHDTTAMTLNAALGYMCLREDFQEEMYQEIMSVMPTEADCTFENSSKLHKVQACFLEAARLFPAGFMWIRDTSEDTVLEHVGPNRDERIAVPAGTRFVVDAIGLHHNPRHFPDPEAFKPERWYGAHENALTMFSVGSRVCIGRRFSITEGICFLAKLVRDWRVEILAKEGETKAEWEERCMRGHAVMNFGVGDVPIRLIRRV